MEEPRIKCIVVGDTNCGKSCLCHRIATNCFLVNHSSTIGVEYRQFKKSINNVMYRFAMWDTAGMERFRSLIDIYYRDARAAIIVFSLNDAMSCRSVEYWRNQIQSKSGNTKSIVLVIGAKGDLKRTVSEEEVVKAQRCADFYVEISAKDDTCEDILAKMSPFLHAVVTDLPIQHIIHPGGPSFAECCIIE